MTKWEYLVDDIDGVEEVALENGLDFHGENGWELVAIVKRRAYFKRPIAEDAPDAPDAPDASDQGSINVDLDGEEIAAAIIGWIGKASAIFKQ